MPRHPSHSEPPPEPSRRTVLQLAAISSVAGLTAVPARAEARPTPACVGTDDNLLGPFWLEGSPDRADLTEPGLPGTRLRLSGRVLDTSCVPLAGAVLFVWHADDRGAEPAVYSETPSGRLRGRITTDAAGAWAITTLLPGHYLNGKQFRPAHIHFRVGCIGHAPLITQLYFAGDPYNSIDPFIESSLIVALATSGEGRSGQFDFVLPPV